MKATLVFAIFVFQACTSVASNPNELSRFEVKSDPLLPLGMWQKPIRKMTPGMSYDDVRGLLCEAIDSTVPQLPFKRAGDATTWTSYYHIAGSFGEKESHTLELQYHADRLVSAVVKQGNRVVYRRAK